MSYLEKIDELTQIGEFKKAIAICMEHEDDPEAQLRYAKIEFMKGELYKAEEICQKHKDNINVRSFLIKVLTKLGKGNPVKYEEAKEYCREYLDKDDKITSQFVKILIKQGLYEAAEKKCKEYIDNVKFISQLITIYINQDRLEEAKELCLANFDQNMVKSQYVTILIKEGKLEEAKEICMKYKEHETLQSQYITILMNEGKYEEAKEIAEKNRNSRAVKSQLRMINKKLGLNGGSLGKNKDKDKGNEKVETIPFINIIKTRIYMDDIPREFIEEIKKSDLDDWQKMISIIAIYKKRNENKNAEAAFKETKRMFRLDQVKTKKLNNLGNYVLSTKSRMFDWDSFDKMMKWEIDEKYAEEIRQIRKQEEGKNEISNETQEVKEDKTVEQEEIIIEGLDDEPDTQVQEQNVENAEVKEDRIVEQKQEEVKEDNNANLPVVPKKVKKNKNKEKSRRKEEAKESITMGEAYKSLITKIKVKINVKANSSNIDYLKDFNTLDSLEDKAANSLRAKMQLLMFLRKYGYDKDAKEALPKEYEIYELVNKMILYKRADAKFDDSKMIEEILKKAEAIDGDNEYIYTLLDSAIQR